jgi:hypothetical protein
MYKQIQLKLILHLTVQHRINLTDDNPIAQPYRRTPPSQYTEVKQHIQDLLDKNIIKESTSPYAAWKPLAKSSVLKNFDPFNASRDSSILGSGNASLTVFRFNFL